MSRRNFHSAVVSALAVSVLALRALGPGDARAATTVFPVPTWSTVTPEAAGLDPAKLDQLAALAGGSGLVLRDGAIVRTWGDPATGGDWASAGKPVLSTLLFLADTRGLTTLDATMGDYLTGGSEKDRGIRFHDLANMVSGYSRAEWPAEAFAYNDHAINLYGHVLLVRVYGGAPSQIVPAELAFLGFEDEVVVSDAQIGRIKRMSVRDFARLGLFWLERGNWNGTQVVPSGYFSLVDVPVPPDTPMTTGDGPESWDFGSYGGSDDQGFNGAGSYAMNFWTNAGGLLYPGFPETVVLASGHDDTKVCWLLPELSLVAVGFGTAPAFGRIQGLQILHDAVLGGTPVPDGVETSSWGAIKARHR
jgi:CubicO group peptidase (beta-lactamase class C family)